MMSFRYIVLGFGVISLAGWYAIAHSVTKVEKVSPQELAARIKTAVDEVNAGSSQSFNDWLQLKNMDSGMDWFGFNLTANKSDVPDSCRNSAGAVDLMSNSCITRETLRNFYCKYDGFRKLPTPNGFINAMTMTYEIKFDGEPAGVQGQFQFESCKGFGAK
jgi:hypothetical protein